MPERYPPGVPCWVDTLQPDPEAAVGFYGGLFDWEFEDWMPHGAPGQYYVGRLDGRDVAAVGTPPGEAPATWNTYIRVAGAEDACARTRDAGGSVLVEPFDVADAGRMAVLADPADAVFCVWEAGRHRGAGIVNAPGTWNWSDLHTGDPEGAKAFYGAVFGWEASTLDFGTMWRLPGYGDALAEFDPEIRRRHAEAGVPAGFSDAIGWLVPADGDEPSRWSVTFAVDDADAIADRAAELGGAATVPPFDAGPARIAVLRDPQGAQFTVSRYLGG